MHNLNLTAKSLSFGNIQVIPLDNLAERLMNGEIIVVPKCLQAIDYFENLIEASLAGICQAVGDQKATQIKEKGFEAFHEVIGLEDLASVSDCTYEIIHKLAPSLSKALVKQVFRTKQGFYLEKMPNVRFHIPYDIVCKKKEEFGKFYWNGKITPHGPHHDSWYQCPTNCINVWIAIGSVKIGNGLNIYPEVYKKRLPCTKEGKILRDQYFGSAINFDLEPGDALIFHGEHLHSSEINSTDKTRFVISFRMTLNKPEFLEESPYKEDYLYFDNESGFKAKSTENFVKKSRFFMKLLNSILGKKQSQNYIMVGADNLSFDDTSSAFPQPISSQNLEKTADSSNKLVFDFDELPIGKIKPISPKICVARLSENQVIAFSRYCSHEGADLAAGYLRDGSIMCPWHNLAFSSETGASPCESLSNLALYECVVKGNKVEVQI